jgi:Zn-dependent peptidase ImmA (M78 family)
MRKGVPVNGKILVWAREKAGFAVEEAARYIDVPLKKLAAWESGDKLPTMNQLEDIAKFYCRPVITFFMSSPPIEVSSLKDFRTVGSHHTLSPSKFFAALKIRVEILHDTLKEIADSMGIEKKSFVGSISDSTPISEVVEKLKELLAWDDSIRRKNRTPRDLFNNIRDRAMNRGVLIVLKGDLGSHYSKVSEKEFRGICLADNTVPLIVINPYDRDRARIFTLVHELVHILLGDSGISGDMLESSFEREAFCNKAAGEFLVPSDSLLNLAQGNRIDLTFINKLADDFRISKFVISRRLFDTHLINKDNFNSINKRLEDEWREFLKKEKNTKDSDRVDPNKLVRSRIGKPVLNLIINASDDGVISYSQASVALGIKPSRFSRVLE